MECPICLDQFSNEVDDYFVTTRNGHIFHNSCLSRVKTRTCPTCRDCSIEECDLIRLRNVDAVRSVSEKPAAENSANQEFQILSDLILLGDKERFKNFMDTSQFDAKYKDELTGKNLAHISAENGRLGILQFLRDGVGLNMDEVDGSGAKILDIALRSGHNDIVSFLVPDTSSGPLLMMDVATNPSTSTTHFEQGETPSISRSDLEQSDNEDDCRTIFIDHNPSSSFLKSASLNDQDSDYKLVIVGVGQAKPVKFQFSIAIKESGNILFHFDAAWDGDKCNCKLNSWAKNGDGWGRPEKLKLFSIRPGSKFRIKIQYKHEEEHFLVRVNDEARITFQSKIYPQTSTLLVALTARNVKYESAQLYV